MLVVIATGLESVGASARRSEFETPRIELCLPLNILVGWPETIDLVSPPPIEPNNRPHVGPPVSEPGPQLLGSWCLSSRGLLVIRPHRFMNNLLVLW